MKKYIYLFAIIFLSLLIASCDSTTEPGPVEEDSGKIFITSDPQGALIFVDGENKGKITPDSTESLPAGNHEVRLEFEGYRDTTFTVNVVRNLTTTKFVELTSTMSVTPYGPVRIWESADPSTDHPSGIDLSTGEAVAVSDDSENGRIDIYYSTTGTGGEGWLVQSADLNTTQGLTRETTFYISNGTNLDDGEDSPNSNFSGWTKFMDDREDNYAFLYDDDSHYSKLKITDFGGGTGPGDPAWVEVTWIYNNTQIDTRF